MPIYDGRGGWRDVVMGAGVGALALAGVIVWSVVSRKPATTPATSEPAPLTVVKTVVVNPPKKELSPSEQPPEASDPDRYFDPKKAIPHFKFKDVSDGSTNADFDSVHLARWTKNRMPWVYISGASETTIPMAMKDVAVERGKRLCFTGVVANIQKSPVGYFVGAIAVDAHIARFIAVHDTGEIVDGSVARLCAIVTGRMTFLNAAGGTTHAIHVVGMFDIPSNRKVVPSETPANVDWAKHVPKDSL